MPVRLLTRCALGAALAVVLLYLASLAPSGRLGLTAAAGLAATPAILSGGWKAGLLTYGAALPLAFFLVPDKGIFFLFALFFGIYPGLKALLERYRPWLCLAHKFLLANAALLVYMRLGQAVFAAPEWLLSMPFLLYLGYNAAFFLYDFGYSQLLSYLRRFDKLL